MMATSAMLLKLSCIVFAILAATLDIRSAHATWLFSDDFDDLSGSVPTGVGIGVIPPPQVGSIGAWRVNEPVNGGASATVSVVDSSLVYSGNNYTVGGAGGKKVQVATHTSTSVNWSVFDRAFPTQSGEVWLAFTFEVNGDDFDQTLAPMIFFGDGRATNIGTEGFFGYGLNGSVPGTSQVGLRRGTSTFQTSAAHVLAADSTYYIVARMWKDADTTYNNTEMWINPVLGVDESLPAAALARTESWNAVNSAMQGTNTSTVGLRWFGAFNDGRAVFLDNFRVGQTWEDIRPSAVPEPGATMLVGMALAGTMVLRRRAE